MLMQNFSLPLPVFLEILAAFVAAPAAGFYTWRGIRRRRAERLALRSAEERRLRDGPR